MIDCDKKETPNIKSLPLLFRRLLKTVVTDVFQFIKFAGKAVT